MPSRTQPFHCYRTSRCPRTRGRAEGLECPPYSLREGGLSRVLALSALQQAGRAAQGTRFRPGHSRARPDRGGSEGRSHRTNHFGLGPSMDVRKLLPGERSALPAGGVSALDIARFLRFATRAPTARSRTRARRLAGNHASAVGSVGLRCLAERTAGPCSRTISVPPPCAERSRTQRSSHRAIH